MPQLRESTVESWNLAIEDGLEFRRKYGREAEWAGNESLFYHAHVTQEGNVGPNIMASTGDSLLSSLLVPNPFFLVEALEIGMVDKTPVLERQLNKLLKELEIRQEAEVTGLHAFLYGKGILKIGYDSEFGYHPKNDFGAGVDQTFGMSLTQFSPKGSRIEFDTTINPGMPWCRAVLPHDFVVPFGVKELKNCPWAAHRCVRHIDDIKADVKYSNKGDLQPTLSMADWVKSYLSVIKPYRMGKTQWSGSRESSDLAEYVELWEIHDARTRRVYVIANGHDKFLRNDIDYLQVDGLPFVDLSLIPKSRTFWVTPDSVYLQNTQAEAIDIASVQRTQRRMSTMRFGYQKGMITNDNLQKYTSGKVGIGIEFEGPMNEALMMMTPTNNNNQLQIEGEAIRRDARETVGFGRNQVGTTNPGRPTATEISIANDKSEMRMGRRENAVAQMYSNLGCKLANLIFTFWRTPRLLEIIGPDGAAAWTSFTGPQLKGDYHYSVGFSSEPVETRQTRINRALTVYQTMAMDPTVDPLALRRYLVRAINDPEFTSIFKPGLMIPPGVNPNANLPTLMQQPQMQPQVGNPRPAVLNGGGGSIDGGVSVPQVRVPESSNV